VDEGEEKNQLGLAYFYRRSISGPWVMRFWFFLSAFTHKTLGTQELGKNLGNQYRSLFTF